MKDIRLVEMKHEARIVLHFMPMVPLLIEIKGFMMYFHANLAYLKYLSTQMSLKKSSHNFPTLLTEICFPIHNIFLYFRENW